MTGLLTHDASGWGQSPLARIADATYAGQVFLMDLIGFVGLGKMGRTCAGSDRGDGARGVFVGAQARHGGKDFSAMVDVLCDLAEIETPRLTI